MKVFIILASLLILLILILERVQASNNRKKIKHVIHVNGTRGKSGVTRLIAAALSQGGLRVMCKSTGTLPMIIHVDGSETEIKRRGPSNIREQLRILKEAAKEEADVLVIECMAVDPELQYVAEHKMLHSDIGVITNARVDHVAEMGKTETDVADCLVNTIPEKGILITEDPLIMERGFERAKELETEMILVSEGDAQEVKDKVLFPENAAIALKVSELLGIEREVALQGMEKVKEDPFTSSFTKVSEDGFFLDGFSANDPTSTKQLYEKYVADFLDYKKVFILNARKDRGYRTDLMLDFILSEKPDQVILLGANQKISEKRLKNVGFTNVLCCDDANQIALDEPRTFYFGIGNIKGEGMKLIERVKG